MHHLVVCVNAAYLGFEVTGLLVSGTRRLPDTPRDLRVNAIRCV